MVVEVPKSTPSNKEVYLSGNFEGWSGGRAQFRLKEIDGKHFISIPRQAKDLQYKFTLGSWDFVERDDKGNNIENRHYAFEKDNDTIYAKVLSWANPEDKPTINSSASENVMVLDDAMEMPQLNLKRRIWVYLPPDYKTSKKSYPVLYMHDGQNIFDVATSYAGEWEVDETLNRLQKENGLELIVIGIDNGDENRMNEYSPWENPAVLNPQGDAYLKFIVETLKPKVDSTFRTKTDKSNTAIMGSSMGGLISHYAGLNYSDTFGRIGVFSPSFWISEKGFENAKKKSSSAHNKMYFLMGSREGSDMIDNMERMKNVMLSNGFESDNQNYDIVEGGTHSENFWRMEFPKAISW